MIHEQWKLKCMLCDSNGWAVLSDCLDYYTYIEPNKDKLKHLRAKIAPDSEGSSDESKEKGKDTQSFVYDSKGEGSYTV